MDDRLGREGGGKEVGPIRGEREGRRGVRVAHQGVHLLVFAEVDNLELGPDMVKNCTKVDGTMVTHVDLVVQRTRVYARAVCTPAYRGYGAAQLIHAHWVLRALIASLPDADRAVVPASSDKLDPSAACERSVQGINDTAVGVEFTHTLAGREVRDTEGVVCRDSVHELGRKRPL